jgi:hypothetical protein
VLVLVLALALELPVRPNSPDAGMNLEFSPHVKSGRVRRHRR